MDTDTLLKSLLFSILIFPGGGNSLNLVAPTRIPTTTRIPTAQCPNGYLQYSDSCYKFYHELLSWPESITFCQGLGEHLVKMESREEFNYLRTQANAKLASFPGSGFWIGATDAIEEGHWQWIDPLSPMTRDQVIWIKTEPSNLTREDCATLWRHGLDHLIGDYFCSSKLYVICEKELPYQNVLG